MPASPSGTSRDEKPKSSRYMPTGYSKNAKPTVKGIQKRRSPLANDSDDAEESPYIKNNAGGRPE